MLEQVKIFLLLYLRPLAAMGRILDHGATWFAIVLAVITSVVLYGPAMVAGFFLVEAFRGQAPGPASPEHALAVALWGGLIARLPWLAPALIALVFVPVSIVILAAWEGLGSAGVVLRRDYMPSLVCHLFAWAAAFLPAALLEYLVVSAGFGRLLWWAPWAAALGFFLTLSACANRKVPGAGFPHAAVTVAGASAASLVGAVLFAVAGGGIYLFLSPWALYYAYLMFGSEVRSFSSGLSSRQRMKRLLELATLNPRDADAHCQLGLIYQQRRDYEQAIAAFERALAIDPSEAEPHYQLGRIAREQGRPEAALVHLERAAKLDDKHASSEVWREMGAALEELGRSEEARQCLAKFVERHPYDAEGLYRLGLALDSLGRQSEAREAFRSAVEAVETAPPYRRRQIRQWGSLAAPRARSSSSGAGARA